MKFIYALLFLSYCLYGCNSREQEKQLEAKTKALEQREMQLVEREKVIALKEEELLHRQKLLDSSATPVPDSLATMRPEIEGRWDVVMRCVETNCSGSAVGDVKNEQWEIDFHEHIIRAQAFSDKQLVREYLGTYGDNGVELSTMAEGDNPSQSTKMLIRIKEIGPAGMTGEREIIRPDCRILYALNFKKQ